jgi:hypothetical protein
VWNMFLKEAKKLEADGKLPHFLRNVCQSWMANPGFCQNLIPWVKRKKGVHIRLVRYSLWGPILILIEIFGNYSAKGWRETKKKKNWNRKSIILVKCSRTSSSSPVNCCTPYQRQSLCRSQSW